MKKLTPFGTLRQAQWGRLSASLCFLLLCGSSYGQMISGAILEEGRKMTGEPKFIVEGMTDGYAMFELSVNMEGEVTGVRLTETNLKSTPAKFELRNYVKKFTFEKGTYFPKFHHVIVKITMVKPMETAD